MTYEQTKHLKSEDFKRLCGVRPETKAQMVAVMLEQATRKRKPGRPNKLSIEDQLLLSLEYWREYRTVTNTLVSLGESMNRKPIASSATSKRP